MSEPRWTTRPIPEHLTDLWRRQGRWDDTTMGTKIGNALRTHADQTVRIHSLERPWEGTFADLRARALALVGGLSANGVRAGDAVAFQLPNWVEAAVAFYASTFLGAVVVPIVHFYGPKEVSRILRHTEVAAFVTAASFGRRDYVSELESVCEHAPSLAVVAVVGAGTRSLPGSAVTFESLEPVNLIDVWDPAQVLSTMLEHRLSAGSGATYFLTSLLDHPDLSDEHLRYLRFVGLGGHDRAHSRHREGQTDV